MNRKLPPLKSLVAFESVVRLQSVTRAAEELCVTHGAVSKQIATLEAWFGRPLFDINRKQMRPTAAAIDFAHSVGEALEQLTSAADTARHSVKTRPLRVIAPSTMATRWLIPRLWSFSAEHQDIAIQVRHTDSNEEWLQIPFDVAIRSGGTHPAPYIVRPLFEESLTVAVAPSLMAATPLWRPADLGTVRVLNAATRPGELERWLERAGVDSRSVRVTSFPHFYLALEATLAGAGALVCPRITLADLVARQSLVEPWPHLTVTGSTYAALCRSELSVDPAIASFLDWLERVSGI